MLTTETGREIDRVIQNYQPHWHHDGDDISKWQPVIFPQAISSRSWRNDDATEKQLNYLRFLGHVANKPMTKGTACDLIGELKNSTYPPFQASPRPKNAMTERSGAAR